LGLSFAAKVGIIFVALPARRPLWLQTNIIVINVRIKTIYTCA
jgi:hypothetical protein